jgi:hypothetical protein
MRAWLAAADDAPAGRCCHRLHIPCAVRWREARAQFGDRTVPRGVQCVATTCAGPAVADGRFRVVVYL